MNEEIKLVWDNLKSKRIPMPKRMQDFLNEINELCKKHNLSISHEDGHGGFEVEEYSEYNINWLNHASKNYEDDEDEMA